MNRKELYNYIKSIGRTSYALVKGESIHKKWSSFKREYSLFIDEKSTDPLYEEKPQSILGFVSHSLPDDSWPSSNGKPLLPLLQITSAGLPYFREEIGNSVKMIVIFYNNEKNEIFVKEYPDVDSLTPIKPPPNTPLEINPYLITWEKIIDYPSTENLESLVPPDVGVMINKEFNNEYEELFSTYLGSKFGGYPLHIPQPYLESYQFILQLADRDFETVQFPQDSSLTIFRDEKNSHWFCD